MLTTNNPVVVGAAKVCYEEFPTVVNALKESGLSYDNSPEEYARLDNLLAKSRRAIGESSNVAQLALSYYWSDPKRVYVDNFIILAVLAQVAIDSSKKIYEVDPSTEIKRIKNMECMLRNHDYPEFMKYTRPLIGVSETKSAYEQLMEERKRLIDRIDVTLSCPMNHLQEWLDKIQGASKADVLSIESFLVYHPGKPRYDKITKAVKVVMDFEKIVMSVLTNYDGDAALRYTYEYEAFLEEFETIKIHDVVTISRMISSCITLCSKRDASNAQRRIMSAHARKIMNALYRTAPEKFLECFESA